MQPGKFRSLFDQVTGRIANMAYSSYKIFCGDFTRRGELKTKALFQKQRCFSLLKCILTLLRCFFVLVLFSYILEKSEYISCLLLLWSKRSFAKGGGKKSSKGVKWGRSPSMKSLWREQWDLPLQNLFCLTGVIVVFAASSIIDLWWIQPQDLSHLKVTWKES